MRPRRSQWCIRPWNQHLLWGHRSGGGCCRRRGVHVQQLGPHPAKRSAPGLPVSARIRPIATRHSALRLNWWSRSYDPVCALGRVIWGGQIDPTIPNTTSTGCYVSLVAVAEGVRATPLRSGSTKAAGHLWTLSTDSMAIRSRNADRAGPSSRYRLTDPFARCRQEHSGHHRQHERRVREVL